jgi:hypothetical protein
VGGKRGWTEGKDGERASIEDKGKEGGEGRRRVGKHDRENRRNRG